MRKQTYAATVVRRFFDKNKIATMDQLKLDDQVFSAQELEMPSFRA